MPTLRRLFELEGSSLALALLAAVGCGGGEMDPEGPGGDGAGGEAGGGGAGSGEADGGCAPGEWPRGDACVPAGIPADGCGEGFEPDGAGACRAILPATACGPGTMALPGEAACREVAPCPGGRFGELPDAPAILHVDAAYEGDDGDGTAARPFSTLTGALLAAEPGAVVALAEGVYEHGQAIVTPVSILGRCPGLVAIEARTANFALGFLPGSAGSSVRGVALRGGGGGVFAEGTRVAIGAVWMQGLAGTGVTARGDAPGETEVLLEDALVERAQDAAVLSLGARVIVERSVLRDTRTGGGSFGRGVEASPAADAPGAAGSELVLRRSIVEGSLDTGVLVFGSRADIEDTLVRATRPHASSAAPGRYGRGIVIAYHEATGARSEARVFRSIIASSHDAGVLVGSSDILLESVLVDGVAPQPADGTATGGVVLQPNGGPGRPVATLRGVTVRGATTVGVLVAGAEVTAEGLLVEDARPEPSGSFGNGLGVRPGFSRADASRLALRGARVARVRSSGVFVAGSSAEIDGLLVEDVDVREADGLGGFGVAVQGLRSGEGGGARTSATLTRSRIERGVTSGLNVFEADVVAEDLVVRAVRALGDGRYGDGISVVAAEGGEASLALRRGTVEGSARAGLLASAGRVAIAGSAFRCNAFALTEDEVRPSTFVDEGGSTCGCGGGGPCRVVSASLEPPPPLPEP